VFAQHRSGTTIVRAAAALPGLKHTERIRKPKRHSSRITNTGRPAVKDKH